MIGGTINDTTGDKSRIFDGAWVSGIDLSEQKSAHSILYVNIIFSLRPDTTPTAIWSWMNSC